MTLEQKVRDFYGEQRLDDADVDAILAVEPAKKPRGRWWVFAGAAALTAAPAAVMLVIYPASTPDQEVEVPATVDVAVEPDLHPPPADGELPGLLPAPPPAVTTEGRGGIAVKTRPPGAKVFIDGVARGTTPLVVRDLPYGKHTVELRGKKQSKRLQIVVARPEPLKLVFDLGAEPPPPAKSMADKYVKAAPQPEDTSPGECNGPPATLSVMPIGQADCTVKMGGEILGRPPFFKRKVPSGVCDIEVTCPSGKFWRGRKRSEPGSYTKIVIRPDDWSYDELLDDRWSAEQTYKYGTSQLTRKEQFGRSVAAFKRCIELDAEYARCYRALAITYARAGNGPMAYRWYKKYVEIAPDARDADEVRKLIRDYEGWRDSQP